MQILHEVQPRPFYETIWAARDGEIPIKDLSDGHIINIVNYFRRLSPSGYLSTQVQFVYEEGVRRGLWPPKKRG